MHIPFTGNYSIFVKSSPMLYDVFYNAAKKVRHYLRKRAIVLENRELYTLELLLQLANKFSEIEPCHLLFQAVTEKL